MNKPRSIRHRPRQSGVVLLVALVMLVVIGLASVAIMRSVSTSDGIAENSRRQNQAMQAAQAALLYCEQQIAANNLAPANATTGTENWQVFSNWKLDIPNHKETEVNSILRIVPASFLKTSGSAGSRYDKNIPLPKCMAQQRTVGTEEVIVVTAVGLSDDFSADNAGRTLAGATVWLQSFIRFGADS